MTLPTFHTRTKELVNGESGLGIITAQIEILSYAKPYISLVESQASEIERQNKIIEIVRDALLITDRFYGTIEGIWPGLKGTESIQFRQVGFAVHKALAQIAEIEKSGEK